MITVKCLGPERLEDVMAFDRICFPTDYWKAEDWKELMEDERAVYYAALADGQIVGDVFIYNWQGEKDYVKIMNVAVHPDWRGQGLAARLLNRVTEDMRALGMGRFCGETRASNRAMQHTFEACGYRLDRVEEHYYDHPDESAYKYVLQVEA